MKIKVIKATKKHQVIITNLMQFYYYDFSEYLDFEVEKNGLFQPYPDLETYWEDKLKFPYIIKIDNQYVGFALVRNVKDTSVTSYFSITEFFILKKYRQQGIGSYIAFQIFDLHKGNWQICQIEKNKVAQLFWHSVISSYTNGQFSERLEYGKLVQNFENHHKLKII